MRTGASHSGWPVHRPHAQVDIGACRHAPERQSVAPVGPDQLLDHIGRPVDGLTGQNPHAGDRLPRRIADLTAQRAVGGVDLKEAGLDLSRERLGHGDSDRQPVQERQRLSLERPPPELIEEEEEGAVRGGGCADRHWNGR